MVSCVGSGDSEASGRVVVRRVEVVITLFSLVFFCFSRILGEKGEEEEKGER